MFNGSKDDYTFKICPPPRRKVWYRAIDTNLSMDKDIPIYGKEEYLKNQDEYFVSARSIVVLLSKLQ